MSVIDIKEDGTVHSAVETTTGLAVPRKFTVKFDDKDNPVNRPILALTAATSALSIPARYASHPNRQGLYVVRKSTQMTAPFLCEVTVEYSASWEANRAAPIAPWNEKPKIRWGSMPVTYNIYRDINDKKIMNSAREPYIDVLSEEYYDITLTIVRNTLSFRPSSIELILNHVNNATFYEFPKGSVLCTHYGAEDAWYNNQKYFIVTEEYRIRTKNGSPDGKADWIRRVPDMGFSVLHGPEKLVASTSDYPKSILGADGEKITEPAMLDGTGGLLDIVAKKDAKPVYLEFVTKETGQFNEK